MVAFEDLLGLHELSGLETSTEKTNDYYNDDAMVVYFVLDGITYKAKEDPDDGYRSSMESFEVETEYKVRNVFPPQKVFGKMRPDDYDKNDTIEFFDVTTSELVLALGTDSYDDWYPCFVFNWQPENMAINKDVDYDRTVGIERGTE